MLAEEPLNELVQCVEQFVNRASDAVPRLNRQDLPRHNQENRQGNDFENAFHNRVSSFPL